MPQVKNWGNRNYQVYSVTFMNLKQLVNHYFCKQKFKNTSSATLVSPRNSNYLSEQIEKFGKRSLLTKQF